MKAYVCDICKCVIEEPYSARMREFCFTVSLSDIHPLPTKDKVKTKIHLCNICFNGFKDIARKIAREKGGE